MRKVLASERGSGPIWFLGLALAVLMLGAVSFELWRAIGVRQELGAVADAAAIAAASAIDLDHYRQTGELVIDAVEAARRGRSVAEASSVGFEGLAVQVGNDQTVTVTVTDHVPYGLIRILALSSEEFEVEVRATAYPNQP
jgi:Flp pilus assembly protein TadG